MKPLRTLTLAIVCCAPMGSMAEDPPTQRATSPSELTEGLLDLLKEPAKTSSSNGAPARPSQPGNPAVAPPLDGEDIGKGPANPLAEVQLGMSTLANWLRAKSDLARTKELQRDVVLRLDELIGQLENQSPSQSNSSSGSSSSSSSGSAQQKSDSQSTSSSEPTAANNAQSANRSANGNKADSGNKAESSSGSSDNPADPSSTGNEPSNSKSSNNNRPGQSAGRDPQQALGQPGISKIGERSVTVDLNDPRALQRSAWGSLPDRMREQMQSRMVERFLPSYRDEIEAYYRALVK